MDRHLHYEHQLLNCIQAGQGVSQRSLAGSLGIALGLTNLLVRKLIKKGFVRAVQVQPNRMRYLVTPAGIAEKARMSRAYLQYSIKYYADVRNRVSASLREIASDMENTERRIVLWGAGEVAEIAYLCLMDSDLVLVAVVDHNPPERTFGGLVRSPTWLARTSAGNRPFDRIVVALFDERPLVLESMSAVGITPDEVSWL